MLLKSDHIARLLTEKEQIDPLILTPQPDIEELETKGSASVDLRLGTWFLSLRGQRLSSINVLGEDSEISAEARLTKSHYIAFGDHLILHPRTFLLGVTLEWMRIPTNLGGYVVGKSSWGRRGLIIATAVGVHPGFNGCLTLEIANVGEVPIQLVPGMRICQLFLHETKHVADSVDQSQFVGSRKPSLGRIILDDFTKSLSKP